MSLNALESVLVHMPTECTRQWRVAKSSTRLKSVSPLPSIFSPSLGLLSAISPLFHHHDPSSFPSSSSYFWSLSTIFHALAASGRWTVQLAYSRDQSGGTRATRINDHQRDDSFFAECARDKSRFRCFRRHHAAHAYPPLLVCPQARGGALYRLFSDPFRE